MEDRSPVDSFIAELVALCTEYDVRLFPRKDSERLYISAEIGSEPHVVWIDFTRVSAEGARQK